MRSRISCAALFVNVIARISFGSTPCVCEQVRDAVGEHARLARARAGDHEHRPLGGRDGLALGLVQVGEVGLRVREGDTSPGYRSPATRARTRARREAGVDGDGRFTATRHCGGARHECRDGRRDGHRAQGLDEVVRRRSRAVRGIDVSIAPGETVALLGPNGAGKSTTIDMLLGLLAPDARHGLACSARPPRDAVDAGAVGAMLQTGALIRDLTVRELVDDDGLALPARRSPVDEVLELTGHRATSPTGARRSSPAARRSACASPSRSSANPDLLVLDEPTVAMDVEGRHALLGDDARRSPRAARRSLFATHYLEEADAYADRVVLMAHGRDRRRRADDRDQGDGRHAHDPRDAARRRRSTTLERAARRHATPSAAARRSCSPASTPTPRSARCSPRYPEARDIEISGAGLEEAFLELTGDDDDEEARAMNAARPTPATSCCARSATGASSSSRSASRSSSTS